MSNATRHWVTLTLSLALSACGGGSAAAPGASEPGANSGGSESGGGGPVPNAAVHKTGDGTVTALIGPPGGSLELAGGPRVEVPPGAVSGGQEFVLKLGEKSSAFHNKESEKSVGPIFIFSPELNAPDGRAISVSIPLAAYPQGWGDVAIAYEISEGEVAGAEDSIRTKWQYERAKLSGGRAVAELPSVTGLRMQFVLTNLEAQ